MNGPWKAGKSDLQIFIGGGLRDKLLAVGKKAIGNGIYRGYQDVVSYPNSQDSRPVAKFKSQALKRHKTFNGMTKCFQILRQAFCHGVGKIGIAFEAVAVVCQYKIEAEEPLYDILIDDVLHDYSDDESVAHDKYKTDIDTDKEDTDGEDGEDKEDNNNSD